MTRSTFFKRRTFAFISGTVMPGESSRYKSALERMSPASTRRVHSPSVKSPVRSFVPPTSASVEMIREASCSLLISSEKNATRLPAVMAAWRAMFSAKLVLPMPGRAPMMTRSERFRPVIVLSSSRIPVGMPRYRSLSGEFKRSRRSNVSNSTSFRRSRPFNALPWRMSKMRCSAESKRSEVSPVSSMASSKMPRAA